MSARRGFLALAIAIATPLHAAHADDGFFARLADAYANHLQANGESEPAPFRGSPPPLDSPPWPGSDYSFGGSEVIGHNAPISGPLTEALYGTGNFGDWLKDRAITVYGWVEAGGDISSANHKWSQTTGAGGNYPMAYDAQQNTIELNQFAFFVDRMPDEVQTDHLDWGFRFSSLWGEDYRYTFSNDNLSYQRLKDNRLYGVDFCVMCYGEIYVPDVAEGMNIRFGRYISIPDIEAQLAPNNYSYTHSLLYGYDPYTQTGVVDTIKLDRHWTIQLELSGGNDTMPWSRQAQLTPAACVEWTSASGDDVVYPCMNGLNNQRYGYNNIQHAVTTWYHKFNSRWHTDSEFWYMWERQTPNAAWNGVSGIQTTPILGANEAYCAPGKANCFAREYAFVNYLNYEVDHLNGLSLRNEFFNDVNGQRTGIPTWYSEHMISWQHWIGDVITVRPEVAYAHSYTRPAFNGAPASFGGGAGPAFPNGIALLGTANHVVMLSADVIVHF